MNKQVYKDVRNCAMHCLKSVTITGHAYMPDSKTAWHTSSNFGCFNYLYLLICQKMNFFLLISLCKTSKITHTFRSYPSLQAILPAPAKISSSSSTPPSLYLSKSPPSTVPVTTILTTSAVSVTLLPPPMLSLLFVLDSII